MIVTTAARLFVFLLAVPEGAISVPGESQPLTLAVDSCVDVDEDQVRRLVMLELNGSQPLGVHRGPQITVGCVNGLQELRVDEFANELTDRQPLIRTIDLRALEPAGRDARARELALAIAELVRRGRALARSQPSMPISPRPPLRNTAEIAVAGTAPPPAAQAQAEVAPVGDVRWQFQTGAVVAVDLFSGGYEQLGADLILSIRRNRWIVADIRLGGRQGASVSVPNGRLDAQGWAGAVGAGVDLGPAGGKVGIALLAHLQAQMLRFTAESDGGAASEHADLGTVTATGGPRAWLAIGDHIRVVGEVSCGTTVHGIEVRNQGTGVASVSGVAVSSGLGIVAQF